MLYNNDTVRIPAKKNMYTQVSPPMKISYLDGVHIIIMYLLEGKMYVSLSNIDNYYKIIFCWGKREQKKNLYCVVWEE